MAPRRRSTAVLAAAALSVAGLAAGGLTAAPTAAEAGAMNDGAAHAKPVREAWLPSVEDIVYWHWQKDRHGPALTGNESWRHFMAFLEAELDAAGVVGLERNAWTFRRWHTSHWPDDSRWSLNVGGEPVDVASFGANSGATPPEGISAPLVRYRPGEPVEELAGAIAVMRTEVDPRAVTRLAHADYEFRDDGDPSVADPPSVSWRIFPQLMQMPKLIEAARHGGAAGAVIVLDAGRELAAGLYTFPVPAHYDVPTLLLDRDAGARVIEAARAGESANLRLEAEITESEAYQLVGFLPGRDYGTEEDEMIQLVTHTDGPSISQDNGALGLLALVRYFARLPQQARPRTLMVFLDARHYMPGQEPAFAEQDYFARRPGARDPVVAAVGMEHLGQIEYAEVEGHLVPTGRIDPSMVWTTDDERLIDLAVRAVQQNGLTGAVVRNVARPGLHGRSQGDWYGMANPARIGGRPAVAVMGTMGVYWATSSRIQRLDPELFRRQVATFVQITEGLMALEPASPR